MTERFFTNALAAAGSVIGTEKLPADLVAGGSEFITPDQLKAFILAALKVPTDQYASNAATTDFTVPANEVTGTPVLCVLNLTGTLGAGANMTLPTVTALLGAMVAPFDGQTYLLRILNNSSANFAWTVMTNTGWTLSGTVTIAQSTSRDFIVTIGSVGSATATLQNVGSGTV